MSEGIGASSRLSKRLLLCALAVSGFLAVAAFVSGSVGAQQSQQMVASWYGPGFEGATTASGAPFDPAGYTAAHKSLAFGTKLIVTYNGASVVVEVNDRGPFVAGRDLDLSQGAAEYIGLTAVGEAVVDVTYADASTPVGPYSGTTAPQQSAAPQAQNSAAPEQAAPQQNTPQQNATNVQDQYSNDAAGNNAANNAAQDQYVEENVVQDQYDEDAAVEEQYTETTPVVPAAGDLEIPPVEIVIPNSTVERRVNLQEAAPPVEHVAPKAEPIEKVYEAPKVVTGITVLPDTGGLPLLPLAGVAASLLLGGGVAIRMLRR